MKHISKAASLAILILCTLVLAFAFSRMSYSSTQQVSAGSQVSLQRAREVRQVLTRHAQVAADDDYAACPDNNYANSRTGYGSCGQFCQGTSGQFNCPDTTRPVYLNNGDCTCCPFDECRK